MTSPSFVTFTAGAVGGASIRISTQAPICSLVPITPGTQGSDGTLANVTLVQFDGGTSLLVSGTVTATATALGITAPTGPVTLPNYPQGAVALGSLGTDAVSVAGTQYFAEGFNPTERTVTSLAALNGTTASTDKAIYFLTDSAGALLGWTALAGATCSGADAFQSINLVTPVTLPAGRYFSGFQVNGTTTKHRTMAAATYPNTTGSLAGAFGTLAAITPPGTFTAGVGPFMQMA